MAARKITIPPDEADADDAIPRDIDELREELARRVRALTDDACPVGNSANPKKRRQ
jgi:hypothetical protein